MYRYLVIHTCTGIAQFIVINRMCYNRVFNVESTHVRERAIRSFVHHYEANIA